jgi:hypothetical protein
VTKNSPESRQDGGKPAPGPGAPRKTPGARADVQPESVTGESHAGAMPALSENNTEGPSGQPSVEGDWSADELRHIGEEVAKSFPLGIERTELVLMDVAPHQVHAYWNVTREALAEARQRLGVSGEGAPLVLRFHARGQTPDRAGGQPFDVVVQGLQSHQAVELWSDARRYLAELGLRGPDGALVSIARSNEVETPTARPVRAPTSPLREMDVNAEDTSRPPTPASGVTTEEPQVSGPPVPTQAQPAAATEVGSAPAPLPAATAEREPTPAPAPAAAAEVGPARVPARAAAAEVEPALGQGSEGMALRFPEVTPGEGPAPERQDVSARPAVGPSGAPVQPHPVAASVSASGPAAAPRETTPGASSAPSVQQGLTQPPRIEAGAPPGAVARLEAPIDAALQPFAGELSPVFPGVQPADKAAGERPEAAAIPQTQPRPAPQAVSFGSEEQRWQGEAQGAALSEPVQLGPSSPPGLPGASVPLMERVVTYSSATLSKGAPDLEINAELHVHGRARPGSQLTLFGRPITRRPDGSSSVRRPLPEGAGVIPLVHDGSRPPRKGSEGS